MDVKYQPLELNECSRIKEINASQFIGRAWRNVDGRRQLVEIKYQETDFPNGFDNHLTRLENTIRSGGVALGAFFNERLVGFCSVNSDCFGEIHRYALLDQLFISNEVRGRGIGKKLFMMAANITKNKGIEKFYICAGSSEETIAFYFAIGCEEAKEINQNLYQLDTRDYQLEFDFNKL